MAESITPVVPSRTRITDHVLASRARPLRYEPALDGVRGIAILLVLCAHASDLFRHPPAVFSAGWTGVDLFFVLSGFLITRILLKARDKEGYFRTFYARRVLRIFPLYYAVLVLLFVGLAQTHLRGTVGYEILRHNQAWYWLYSVNWLIAFKGWAAAPLNTSHFWSLAIEEQFYLIWPFLVFRFDRRTVRRICVVIIVLSPFLRVALRLAGVSPVAIFAMTPTRLDGLMIGAALATTDARLLERRMPIAGLVGLVTYVALSLVRHNATYTDFLVGTIGFSAIAVAAGCIVYIGTTTAPALLRWPPLVQLGKYSYGMYVLHRPISGLIARHWPNSGWLGAAALLTVSVAAAAASYHFFEKPFLSLKRFVPYASDRPERTAPA